MTNRPESERTAAAADPPKADSHGSESQRPDSSLTTHRERAALLRILDASLNRASEGLRTLEDYARFVLDDASLSTEAKKLRHELAEAAERLSRQDLVQARDTVGDCGTAITTEAETTRTRAVDVCRAAGVRTQQALRSIEEYGKCLDPQIGRRAEAIRYRCYTLAATLETVGQRRERLTAARLYVLVDAQTSEDAFDRRLRELIEAEVDVIQLRDKLCSDRVLLQRARQAMAIIRELSAPHRALLIVNDRPDIAVAAQADGVHVGQDELPVETVRRLVGPEMLVGVSTHNLEQARKAVAGGADYIGCGPTFASHTKSFERFAGLEFLRQIAAEISLPAFAIGGIDAKNVDEVLATGTQRVAVAGAVASAVRPAQAAKELKAKLQA